MLFLLLLACAETTSTTSPACVLDAPVLTPTSAAVGSLITLQARDLTTQWDTAVTIGDTRAEISAFTRDGCDACDVCYATNTCTACGSCSSCDEECSTCVETVTVAVPEVSAGPQQVTLLDHHGRSAPATLQVEAAVDTATDSTP
jgi:hypothetical protein